MEIRPLGERIVVEPLEAEEKTKGGIVLPDNAKEKPQLGKVAVISVDTKLSIKINENVLYRKFSGTEFESEDGKKYLILEDKDILAVIN